MKLCKATIQDISRIAEILVFTKRINYRNEELNVVKYEIENILLYLKLMM